MVSSMGESGSRVMERVVRMAIERLTGLLMCHCFIWFVVWGGSVIAVQYARRR